MDATLEWEGLDPAEAAEALEAFRDELPGQLEQAAEDIAVKVAADASREVNVDTGRLRSSIDFVVENVAEDVIRSSVGSNVEYALFHELDYPWLRPAFESNRQYIVDRVTEAVEAARESAT